MKGKLVVIVQALVCGSWKTIIKVGYVFMVEELKICKGIKGGVFGSVS